MVRAGLHLGDRSYFPRGATPCEAAEGLLAFIEQHYLDHPPPARLVLSHDVAEACAPLFEATRHKVSLGLPRNERERAWLAIAEKNAELALQARRQAATGARARLEALHEALAERLELAEPPARIECFDISHTQGEATVASCVVCVDGAMKSSEYRRFNITGITPGDDYAAMRQVLKRRYEKVAVGEALAPDLILIDGGRGQYAVAREVLAELGLEHLPTVGIAKGEGRKPGLESLIVAPAEEALTLPPGHPALHLIQTVRDEAHRFAIMGHRARRAKGRGRSLLEDVPGVGPARRRKLLAHFGGLAGVAAATIEDLCRVAGISRALAETIYKEMH
jgi:excinuclease ABC subunit C